MKIACFADLHLTDNFNTVKLSVLRWALNEAKKRKVDMIALLGDMTAVGTMRQSEKILSEISAADIPFCSTCGNAEYRHSSLDGAPRLFDIPPDDDSAIFMINTAGGTPNAADLERLAALPSGAGKVLLTHTPPDQWQNNARELLQQAQRRLAVTALLAGHTHIDSDLTLRGLDPDKAAGAPPGFELLTGSAETFWQRETITMPDIDPATWDKAARDRLHGLFGVCTMYKPAEVLREAAQLHIPHAELRCIQQFPDELPEIIASWRQAGGKTLSMHLAELNAADCPFLAESVSKAIEYRCDRVTLHVPRVIAAQFAEKKAALLDNFDRFITPLLAADISIGIENLHTTPEARSDDTRNFGCNIAECRYWIELLREKYHTDKIGFHCDIGHARNNAPFSSVENLSDYYCEMGKIINGWHFHQVVQQSDGSFKNHRDLTGFFTKLITLGGFLMAHRIGQFGDAPIFLEVTTPNGGINSYRALTEILKI